MLLVREVNAVSYVMPTIVFCSMENCPFMMSFFGLKVNEDWHGEVDIVFRATHHSK